MQDDDGSLLRLETAEAAFELVAIGDLRRGVGGRWRVRDVGDIQVEAAVPHSPDLIDTGVHEESAQPGVEPIRVA